jgi:hypothetical protein
MDPKRRHLFVEGLRDRNFLLWICGGEINSDLTVLTIDSVEFVTPIAGGNRGRLVEFAKIAEGQTEAIMFFADADYDVLLERPLPRNLVVTDKRDLEGYTFNEISIDKILRLSLNSTNSADPIFRSIIEICKKVAWLRILSEENGLQLPFQETNIKKYISREFRYELDVAKFTRALMQNAGMSLSLIGDILEDLKKVEKRMASVEASVYIHGKDVLAVSDKVFRLHGLHEGEIEKLLWAAIERPDYTRYPNLKAAIEYMTKSD